MSTPTTCLPWFSVLADQVPTTPISSGCGIDGNGNVPCDPEAMRADAEAQYNALGYSGSISLEAYTLARYIQSEVGTQSVPEMVAVGEAAVNRADLQSLPQGVLSLLLYRQDPSSPNYGWYGPIHGSAFSAPYGRWAATSQDPTVLSLMVAQLIMSGDTENFSNGADDQDGLEYVQAFPDPAAKVRVAAAGGNYWVGPLPGINHWHTFLWRHYGVTPDSDEGAALLQRGLDAVASRTPPDWSGLPVCPRPATRKQLYVAGAVGILLGGMLAFHLLDKYLPASWSNKLP